MLPPWRLACGEGCGEGCSPLLPVLAQQDADTLMQCGPAGLVSEQGQQVGSERWHLGARMTFALGRKHTRDGPCGADWPSGLEPLESRGRGPFPERPRASAWEAALAARGPCGAQPEHAADAACADPNQLLRRRVHVNTDDKPKSPAPVPRTPGVLSKGRRPREPPGRLGDTGGRFGVSETPSPSPQGPTGPSGDPSR